MGKPTGFLEFIRELPQKKEVKERIKDYAEFYLEFGKEKINSQAARCMDCGVPFCSWGCPLGNNISEFNHMAYLENWKGAYDILKTTNCFPEFTGRVCPAPCEMSCVLGINKGPTTIELIEKTIIEKAFELGIVKPEPPKCRSGKRVAVVGSGPAGLAAAMQLNKAGYWVVVFERSQKPGGLLRYGIPDFKLEKTVIDRRINIMKEEGIAFKTGTNVGVDIKIDELVNDFDAVLLAGGSTVPRDLPIQGRNLNGVHFAMEFLAQQNKRVSNEKITEKELLATGKNVVVIGGGDTGSDCVGTSNRHGAKSIVQLELMPKPTEERPTGQEWPLYPSILRTSTSHEEGVDRHWSVLTKEFIGDEEGNLKAIKIVDIEWEKPNEGGRPSFKEIEETTREVPCELALLAIGFVHPQHEGMINELNIELDERGNVKGDNNYQTNIEKVFTAGDMHRGQSLIVWAISEGREAARQIDLYLAGDSTLETKDGSLVNTENYIME